MIKKGKKKKINFIDCTFRDGHQSLWANRMTAPEMISIAPVTDRAGYEYVEVPTLNSYIVFLRILRENPWEKVRRVVEAMPNTKVIAGMRNTGAWGFEIHPNCIPETYLRRLIAYGYRRLGIFDPLHDFKRSANLRGIAKASKLDIAMSIVYSLSPVHTDEYYGTLAAELAVMKDVDTVYLKDSIGLLTPDRVRTLVPVLIKNLNGKPLEIHSHCCTGLGPLCYLEAIKLGVDAVQTCTSPLANGNSLPSVENILSNIKQMGYDADLDEKALETIASHFTYVAKREGRPIGRPLEYDLFHYEHQIPGGMRSNMESMLQERGEMDRLNQVLKEVAVVRKEMGYPVMITPLSQIIGTQAVLNVLTGERYNVVVEELYKYILGFFGKTPAPVDPNIKDKILSTQRGKEFMKWTPPQPSIEDLRKQLGSNLSDDEILLQLMMPEENIKNLLASGPIKTLYPSPALKKPVMVLIEELSQRTDLSYIHIEKDDFSLKMRKSG